MPAPRRYDHARERQPPLESEPVRPLQPPVEFTNGLLMSLTVWFVVKAALGIAFCVCLSMLFLHEPWVGGAVGTGLSFVMSNAQR